MNNINSYLKDFLTKFSIYELSSQDKKGIKDNQKARWVTNKLLLKKFRKAKVADNTKQDILKKVLLSIEEQRSLHFIIPFGGYKHFWNPSHPEVDWAELFTLKFLSEWVSPILSVHKPGVTVEFISEDLILPLMNNYPEEALNQYSKSFLNLLQIYKNYLPDNLDLEFFRVGDKYDKEKIIKEVKKLLPKSWLKWKTYTKNQKEVELKRSNRAVFWKGREDLTQLSDKEKEERIIESRLTELAYYEVEARSEFLGDYFTRDNRIPICFSFGLSPDNIDKWITLGSTYASTVDFWIGRGILEERGDNLIPRIISHNQYDLIKSHFNRMRTNILTLRNFDNIEIYEGELKFN